MPKIKKVKKRGPAPKKLEGRTFHIVPTYDLLRKCYVCEEIKCIQLFDPSHRELGEYNVIHYNRKCKVCRAAQIKEQRRVKKEKMKIEKETEYTEES